MIDDLSSRYLGRACFLSKIKLHPTKDTKDTFMWHLKYLKYQKTVDVSLIWKRDTY